MRFFFQFLAEHNDDIMRMVGKEDFTWESYTFVVQVDGLQSPQLRDGRHPVSDHKSGGFVYL